jgi:tyrosine-protein kinase Etk/Wzc
MSQNHAVDFLDYLIVIVKGKKVLLAVFFLSLFTSYLCIYFGIPKQYEATATIIPSAEGNSLVGLSSLIKNFSSVLPAGLSGMKQESEMDLYNTIIYCRTSMELLIKKFDVQKIYKIKSKEDAIKALRKSIKTSITLQNAFVLRVRSTTPQRACDMANYLVNYLNENIITMNIAKSKNNRLFLEQRYLEIKENLKNAEDSLKVYQEKSGILEAGKQTMATIETFAKLESDLAAKQIECNVLNKIYGENSPTAANAKLSLQEYGSTINRLKNSSEKSEILIGLNYLPKKALDYFRYYRDVKIYNEMLEFIIPLYEQSKFEEQKMIPILQVIDYAVPPEKKMFPPRTMMAGVIACLVTLFAITFLLFREFVVKSDNQKITLIIRELFNFKKS